MTSTRKICTLIVLLASASWPAIFTQGEPGSDPENCLTVSDVVNLESASQFDISPDGKFAVWVKTTPNKGKNKRQRNIMLTSLADTASVQLTRGPNSDSSPRFSPDGSKIAFLGSRGKDKTQIYVFDFRGGEPEKLTSTRTGVIRFDWLSAAKILYTAREDSSFRERELKKTKDDAIVVADQEHYTAVRLFALDIDKKKTEQLTVNWGRITEFSISPCGRWVVTNENQNINYRYDKRIAPKQFLMDLQTGEKREIFTSPHENPYDFKWMNDGSGFFCRKDHASNPADTYVSISHLYFYDLAAAKLIRVPTDWEWGLGHSYKIVKNGAVAALANGTEDRIVLISMKDGKFEQHLLESPSGKPTALYTSMPDGSRLIYAVSDASSIPEVMTAVIKDGSLEQELKLIDLNEKLKKKKLARTEIISWRGARSDRIEGILYYPPDYKEGKRFPLVALIHGGPAGVDRNYFSERWSNYPHLLSSRGTFVLKVNYHGSGNYSLKWKESIKGHYYDLEVPDILKGIDYLVKKGLADKNKLGIMGWSNGSILAIECCLRSNRFKALCAGAGDVNWTSDYGNCAFGAAFDNAYLGGPPWKKTQEYIKKSPLFRMEKMKTPTLILFGTEDTSVPTQQGWEHFRAMQQIGKAPVRFILFPGASHGLSKLSHQQRKMEEELAWFDRYLFEAHEEENEAFDKTSPLAMELKKARVKRSIGLYGAPVKHILVPEMVTFAGLDIGRFEITRAQFQAFNVDYDFPAGTENHPVSGVSFDEARNYCKWLSEKTGRHFRLPAEEEMEKLLKKARSNLANENNLEHWAGYSPTPEECVLLRKKITELEETRLLVEEVGSFKPVGEEGVYDLGGNVAEWVVDGEGAGKIMGLSAVSTCDQRTPYTPPDSRYVGFRVCEDSPNQAVNR